MKPGELAKEICKRWDVPISKGGFQPTDDGEELSELAHARELAVAKFIEESIREAPVVKNRKKGIR